MLYVISLFGVTCNPSPSESVIYPAIYYGYCNYNTNNFKFTCDAAMAPACSRFCCCGGNCPTS
eukprot:m.9857 g.9857  ORF g.9857 m.9857 type:complete len:63 (+) comp3564_c0_seq1:989-1177(+)